ncbi:DNA-binding response regulator [Paraflavitalea soli]|uniref:DNA-binding response regulator n=1 Tax=Paraflavitalea soli TaxID=2315862 RepID=A0A3B7MLQ6_9BACT|nr:response regulator transcription factor [Paraflavitalea soli]AXY72535.1 DNA-binding response regulator [Paraflavitalea soli]
MKDQNYHVLIADDHAIVRYGTSFVIKDLLPTGTIREANNFHQALKLLDTNRFDLMVLDINIPGGNNLQMIDVIKLRQPHVKILIFSGYDEQVYALRYLQAGADGYVVKQASEAELRMAIQTLQNNDKYISHSVRQHLLNNMSHKKVISHNPLATLSNREMEIMQQLVMGAAVAEIGATLGLQISTVSTYKSRIFEKLNVSNVVDLVEKVRLYDPSVTSHE